LDVGFTLFAISIFASLYGWAVDDPTFRMTMALLYSVGYVFVVIGGSELFTEHTTLAVLPVLDGQSTVGKLARLWGLVYSGNIVGAAAFGAVFAVIGPALHFTDTATLSHIGEELAAPDPWMIVASGILAGWLMGLLSWLVTASRDTVSQIVIVVIVTSVIGLGPLHHCVVGTAELTAAMVANGIDLTAGLVALACSTVGNALGGVLFVALLKYSLIVRSRYAPQAG
jgi:formate/nitrite transporter FocA (FNT family)